LILGVIDFSINRKLGWSSFRVAVKYVREYTIIIEGGCVLFTGIRKTPLSDSENVLPERYLGFNCYQLIYK